MKNLSNELVQYFNTEASFAKEIFRIERNSVMDKILSSNLVFPVTVYLVNFLFFNIPELKILTPKNLIDEFENTFYLKSK